MEKEGVIIIGGSAGSIEVLLELFPTLPSDFPFAIVIVLHRKNNAEHHLEDVLRKRTKMRVLEIQDKTTITPGKIFVTPGDYHLLHEADNTLVLDYSERVNFSRPSIDIAFEEFAKRYKNQCVGILLSGANADGALGLKKIHEAGGLSVVQSPDSAKVATMPMAALNLFQPDVIADVNRLALLFRELAHFEITDFITRIKSGKSIENVSPSVLIVDDLDENLYSLNAILKTEGYTIDKANSGALALKMANELAYDCIVLDVQMPEMDGFEVAKRLSENAKTEAIPVLFLSALGSDKEKILEGLEVGAVDFIAKPPDPSILKVKIKNCITQSIKAKEKNKKLNSIEDEFNSLQNHSSGISASFRYAQNIQQAILPNEQALSKAFVDHFVIYEPKESIGGDFYYFKNVGQQIVFAVGDCTGHGAPGAMMSMMSVNILNTTIEKRGITAPKQILKMMAADFNATFQNENNSATIQDGLEISICMYDRDQRKLYYSGAGGRIFIYAQKELRKLRGNHSGISGATPLSVEFDQHEFDVATGVKVYMFSDGIIDQFGGEHGKKFLTSRLESTLLTCIETSFKNQEAFCRQIINDWKGKETQIDDMTLLGFQLE